MYISAQSKSQVTFLPVRGSKTYFSPDGDPIYLKLYSLIISLKNVVNAFFTIVFLSLLSI